MEKKSSKRKQIAVIFLILAVLLAACSVSVTYYVKNYIPEGTAEPAAEPVNSKTEIPDKNGVQSYLNDIISLTADSSAVKTNLQSEVNIDKDSVVFNSSKANSDTLKYIVSSLSGKICGYYPSHEGDFGDDFKLLPEISLNSNKISVLEFKNGEVNPDDDSTKNEEDFYYFTLEAENASSAKSENVLLFNNEDDLKTALEKVTDSLSDMLDVKECEVISQNIKIDGKTDRISDKLQYINLSADYTVNLGVSFKGEYSALGSGTLTFKMNVKEAYSYTWADVDIEENEIRLTLNEDEPLPLSVTLSDKATEKDYKISFESEDSSAVSVDKDGTLKGLKLGGNPVKVTVKFTYLGKTYTDSCNVYVTVPVKNIKTQPSKTTLSVGESKKLTCRIAPDDATIKDVEWHSEDEKIASVSKDGTVKAVSKGTAKVYAVSLDGYLKSSCTVTVEEVK